MKEHYGTLAPTNERLFTAMNTAAPTDGLILLVTKGVKVEQPIHVLHITTWEPAADPAARPRSCCMKAPRRK